MRKYLIFILFIASLVLASTYTAKSQNEAFHGGKGDGFGMSTTDNLNLNDVNFVGSPLTVTVEQATTQDDPTNHFPVLFTITFSEDVTDFVVDSIKVSGTANPQTIELKGSGKVYTLELSNISQNGEIIVDVPAGVVKNSVGNPNSASVSTDNSVTVNGFDISATITLASGQKSITNNPEIKYIATFSEDVTGFTTDDVVISGSANATKVNISGSGASYNITVSEPAKDGTVSINIPAGSVSNTSGIFNKSSSGENIEVEIDRTKPKVNINFAPGQTQVSNSEEINFIAVFSEKVEGFTVDDVELTQNTGADKITVSETDKGYKITISGMKNDGTISINIPENVCNDLAGNKNIASNNVGNSVSFDRAGPTVEINQAKGQKDPATSLPLKFSITFSEEVKGFSTKKINFGASEKVYLELTGEGKVYEVKIFGVKPNETVSINVPAGVVHDHVGNYNSASKNTDNTITYTGTTGIDDLNNDKECKIFCYNNKLHINFEHQITDGSLVNVYNTNGQKIYSSKIFKQNNTIDLNIKQTIIVVQVKSNNKVYRALIINQ